MAKTQDFQILIVDDFQMARHTLRAALSALGYTKFVEAANGNEAMDVLHKHHASGDPIHLVTCDVNMPFSGIEFLKAVRSTSEFKSLPVVMVTVESEMGLIRDALVQGANDYIVKPYSAKLIEQKLSRLFTKKQAS